MKRAFLHTCAGVAGALALCAFTVAAWIVFAPIVKPMAIGAVSLTLCGLFGVAGQRAR